MLSKTLHLFQSLHSRGRGLTSKVPQIYYSTRGFTNKLRMIKSTNTNYCRNRNRSEPSIMTFQLVKGKYKETNPTNILLFEAITQNWWRRVWIQDLWVQGHQSGRRFSVQTLFLTLNGCPFREALDSTIWVGMAWRRWWITCQDKTRSHRKTLYFSICWSTTRARDRMSFALSPLPLSLTLISPMLIWKLTSLFPCLT